MSNTEGEAGVAEANGHTVEDKPANGDANGGSVKIDMSSGE